MRNNNYSFIDRLSNFLKIKSNQFYQLNQYKSKGSILRRILFFIIILYFYIASLFTGLLIMFPVVVTSLYDNNWGYAFKNILYISISFVIKYLLGTEIYVNSNKLAKEMFEIQNQTFLIQNHFTEIDFFFQTYLLTNLNTLKKILKYKFINVAKKFVGNVFIGVGIHSIFSKDIYLARDINIDNNKIAKRYDECDMIYMFPEGTCFNYDTKKKSDEYVKSNKLLKFQYHLYPRITGMFLLTKKNKNLRTVYDITAVYDTITKDMIGQVFRFEHFFYKYDFPTKVFFNIKKYPIDNSIFFQEKIEFIYMAKDNFIMDFNPNQNQFEKLNYNFIVGFGCFVVFNFFTLLSIGFFTEFEIVRTYYLLQVISYLIYFNFFY